MKEFFGDAVLLKNETAERLYKAAKVLPVVDYHCHLDAKMIADDAKFSSLGELWLAGDHYKWRVMRLNGVDEAYITGNASYRDKFFKYAEIVPQLIGNPLYYWTHLELKEIFGISKPLNKDTAEEIYTRANEKLRTLSVRKLLKLFNVEFIATTDDPADELPYHGKYAQTSVTPTFRPDKLYSLDEDYIQKLGRSAGMRITALSDLLLALEKRMDYFVSKGCRMSDHGFDKFPQAYADEKRAAELFIRRDRLTNEEKDEFFGFLLVWLAGEYARRKIVMQIHFGVVRDVNPEMYGECGADSGFDVISSPADSLSVLGFLKRLDPRNSPRILLYALNDASLAALSALTGAFRNVRIGAAWWFNDTLEGIRRHLTTVAEYSSLGTHPGMLTDSRSFSSYPRFDFFRRILCDYVGEKVEKGEYDEDAAKTLIKNICYNNAKELVEQ